MCGAEILPENNNNVAKIAERTNKIKFMETLYKTIPLSGNEL